ncbi:MAG: hypothetical protein COB26_09460 [Piscirickettsiaceae bacterium]|nr:MAG: hypothetical protein COB26_09460 [Piscirickettsiaceae bacterium]
MVPVMVIAVLVGVVTVSPRAVFISLAIMPIVVRIVITVRVVLLMLVRVVVVTRTDSAASERVAA